MPLQFSQKAFCCLLLAAEKTFSKRVTKSGMHKCLKAWAQEVLCETFSTEPQLCCTLGPAVDVVPGGSCVCLSCRLGPPVAWLCCGCTPALAKWPGDRMAGVQPCPWKEVGICLAWYHQQQCCGHSSGGVQGTDAFCWLMPLCTGLQRMVQVYFWPMRHRNPGRGKEDGLIQMPSHFQFCCFRCCLHAFMPTNFTNAWQSVSFTSSFFQTWLNLSGESSAGLYESQKVAIC